MSLSIVESDAFKRVEEVAELHLQSKTPYQIARKLGIKVVEVKESIAQWQEIVRNDMDARDAARDYLNDMVHRYDKLIARANDNLEDLRSLEYDEKISAQINATIKTIGELDAKRVDFLQKAGMFAAGELGDEMARLEDERDQILHILRNELCPECQARIRDSLSRLTGQVEGNVIEGEVV